MIAGCLRAKNGYRPTCGDRPAVKRILFMAAMSATRSHSNLGSAYKAILARGKKPIVALMRRLIVIAYAVLRDARKTSNLETSTASA